MKEIIIRRAHENYAMMNYKFIIDNGQTIRIGNGETKKIQLDNVPVIVHAKQGWLKSKDVTIDHSTTELILKSAKIKSGIDRWSGGFLALSVLIPMAIWDDYPIAKTISIVGSSILFIWAIYAFVIKRDDWILIEKRIDNFHNI